MHIQRSGFRTRGAVAVAAALSILAAPGFAEAGDEREQRRVVRVLEGSSEGDGGGYLGVSLREETENDEGGARVIHVADGSPADDGGIREGDVIVGFKGDVIRGPARLTERIHAAKPGDEVEITVIRDGRRQAFTVELGARTEGEAFVVGPDTERLFVLPDWKVDEKAGEVDLRRLRKRMQEDRLEALPELRGRLWRIFPSRPKLGVQLVETTPELREQMGGTADAGVLIGKVLTGTPAEREGVHVGDLILSVDGEKVASADELIDALSDKDGGTVDVELVRGRKVMHLRIPLPAVEDEGEITGPRAWLSVPRAPAAVRAPRCVPCAPHAPSLAPVLAPFALPAPLAPPVPRTDSV